MKPLGVLHECAGTRTNPSCTAFGTPKDIWGISLHNFSVVYSLYCCIPFFPNCISDVFPRRIVMRLYRCGRVCNLMNEYVANVLVVVCGKQVTIDHNCRQVLTAYDCVLALAIRPHIAFNVERFVEPGDVGVREFLPALRDDFLEDFTRLGINARFPPTSDGKRLVAHSVPQSSTTSPMR